MPTGGFPDAKGNTYAIVVYTGTPKKATTVNVPNIPVTAGLPNPTVAQVQAASDAKARAIVAAIKAANIPGVDATVIPQTLPGGVYPTGQTVQKMVFNPFLGRFVTVNVPVMAQAQFTQYIVSGVTASVTRAPGNRVTGEVGNGRFNFIPGAGGGGNGSMWKGSYNYTGPASDSTVGLDASGYQSVIGFGFVDTTTSTPTDYIAAFDPSSGLTSSDVLSNLAAIFNSDFGSAGYSATYDQIANTLSIDQALPNADYLWTANSDTGIDFSSNLVSVPDPASFALLATGALGMLILWRRNAA